VHHEVVWVGCGRAVNNLHHFVAKETWGEGPVGATSWLSTANGHSRVAAQRERASAALRCRVSGAECAVGGSERRSRCRE